jgi:hypothetical protein
MSKIIQSKSNTCEHGRNKYKCRDCGTGYCEHNKPKSQCRDCGTGYCEHNKLKYRCRYCKNNKHISKKIKSNNYELYEIFIHNNIQYSFV